MPKCRVIGAPKEARDIIEGALQTLFERGTYTQMSANHWVYVNAAGSQYHITLRPNGHSCECPSAQYGKICKHIKGALLLRTMQYGRMERELRRA